MLNAPNRNELQALPRLYSSEDIPDEDKLIHMHFFLPGYDWYAVTFNGRDSFMGFIVMGGNTANAAWSYFSLAELRRIRLHGVEVERDMEWKPIPGKAIGITTSAGG
jgi:hypothetical protein